MLDEYTDEDWTNIRECLPRLWWNTYQGCLLQGFSTQQAFVLLQVYILSQGSGVRFPVEDGPEADDGSTE